MSFGEYVASAAHDAPGHWRLKPGTSVWSVPWVAKVPSFLP